MNLPDVKYAIPQRHLTAAIEGLQELALRLEIEAAALATVNTGAGQQKAAELLGKAEAVRESADFYLGL